MSIKLKAYGPSLITTYLLELKNKKMMLDFNCKDCKAEDLQSIDYIFLSHEHLDHFGSLLDYSVMKNLNPNVRIFATRTTKRIIEHIAREERYTEEASKIIYGFIDKIEEQLLNKCIELDDNLTLTLYRSGHTFGSSMVYIRDGDTTYLYTGDMDYVSSNPSRQYNLPYHLDVDYYIVDGTNLFKEGYKGVSYKQVKEYIDKHHKKKLSYYARPEKAIFYGLYLAEKLKDFTIVYGDYMKWYLKIITEEGYNPYIADKVIYKLPILGKMLDLSSEKEITFVPDESKFDIDYKLSLHITKNDLVKMIHNHSAKEPKAILVGHYKGGTQEELIQLDLPNVILLKKGGNEIE